MPCVSLAHPCRGNPCAESHLPALFFSPRDPPGAPRTSASPRCTRRAGSAAKPATWARGWCSPAGSTRPSASPAWTVSTCSHPAKSPGHRGASGTTSRHRGPPCAHPLGRAAWMHFVLLAAQRCPTPAQTHPNGSATSRIFPQSFSHLPSKSQPQIQQLPCSRTRWCQARSQVPFQGTVPRFPPSTALQNLPLPTVLSPSEPPVPLLVLPCKGCKIKLGEGEKNHRGSRYSGGGGRDSFLLASSRHIAYVKRFVNVGQVCAGELSKCLQMKWPNY